VDFLQLNTGDPCSRCLRSGPCILGTFHYKVELVRSTKQKRKISGMDGQYSEESTELLIKKDMERWGGVSKQRNFPEPLSVARQIIESWA